jgi:hypothetical protein
LRGDSSRERCRWNNPHEVDHKIVTINARRPQCDRRASGSDHLNIAGRPAEHPLKQPFEIAPTLSCRHIDEPVT